MLLGGPPPPPLENGQNTLVCHSRDPLFVKKEKKQFEPVTFVDCLT